MTLVEPLLPLAVRMSAHDDMNAVCRARPHWGAAFLGGVAADMIRSLPDGDPWRNLSARLGTLTMGGEPPAEPGAVRPDGVPFGTWHDMEDLVGLVFDAPEVDVALAAVAEPLSPAAAAVIAFASLGWEAAGRALRAAHATGVPDGSGEEVVYPEKLRASVAGRAMYEAGSAAIRWGIFRRRAYGQVAVDDPWPVESCFRWSWRADQITSQLDWSPDDIEPTIDSNRLLPRD